MSDKIKAGQIWKTDPTRALGRMGRENTLTILQKINTSGEMWGVKHGDGSLGELSGWFIRGDYMLEGGRQEKFVQLVQRLVRITGETSAELDGKKISLSMDEWEHLISLVEAADKK